MTITVGFLQTNPIFGDKEWNFNEIEIILDTFEQREKIDLLVLPELFATGYTFTSKSEAMELSEVKDDSETARFLQKIAEKIDAVIVGGFIEKEYGLIEDSIYNSAMMVSKDGIIEVYRKIHLFNKEKLWFSPGNNEYPVVELKQLGGVKVGMMICFDWMFPEVTRTLALKGADIIAHPANLVLPYCQKAMITRCLSNKIFAITCNRIGWEQRGEDHFKFTGESQITDTQGKVLFSATPHLAEISVSKIDFMEARDKKLNQYNDIHNDRRPEYYKND